MGSHHSRTVVSFSINNRISGCSRRRSERRGAIAVLAAALIVVVLVMAAFALDIGMMCQARAELQRAADASALAATSDLLHREMLQPTNAAGVIADQSTPIRQVADETVRSNKIFQVSANLALNTGNEAGGEIVIGEMV